MAGWIKLHRDIQQHWIFSFDEPDKGLAWIDLLLMANHDDNQFLIKGRVITCKRGQVAMSQVTLQKRWNMSQNKLKRFLEILKKQSMIDFETNDLTTIITICNYNRFQQDERPDERPDERATNEPRTSHERATNEPRTTNKNVNNVKNENNDKNVKKNISADALKTTPRDLLQEIGVTGQIADDFIAFRKAKKAPISKTVADGIFRESQKAGMPPADFVAAWIESGWHGFKADWLNKQPQAPQSKPDKLDSTISAAQRFLEKIDHA